MFNHYQIMMSSSYNFDTKLSTELDNIDLNNLIELIKSSNQKGFEILVIKYGGALNHYGHLTFGNVDNEYIHNSIIETYIKVINSIGACRFNDEKSFNSWIFKIFTNILISSLRANNALKRGGNEKHYSFEQLSFNNYDLHSDNLIELDIERRNLIDIIFQKLPPKYSIVLWYAAKGYKDEDIANIFRQSVSSIKSLKNRAIKKARIISNQIMK